MKTYMKMGLLVSLLTLGSSLFFYFTQDDLRIELETNSEERGGTVKNLQVEDSFKGEKDTTAKKPTSRGKKYKLWHLEEKKVEVCKNSLKEFTKLGDFFDPNSSVFEDQRELSRKLNYISNEFLISNDNYKAYVELISFSSLSLKKSDFLKISESLSGCSKASDIGMALASTLEAIKIKGHKGKTVKALTDPFFAIAMSEADFVSWDAFAKASGIVLPILMAFQPNSSELKKLRRFRVDTLKGMLNESELIKRSLDYEDARAIIEASFREKKASQTELRRLINLAQDLEL